jgi:hypothetical protein
MAILSAKGVTPEMQFKCTDCGETITGADIIADRNRLTIVQVNRQNPINSVFRCECCQDDYEDRNRDED